MAKNESAENYLETILILSKKLPVVRSVDIATELGYKKSSVSVEIATEDACKMEHVISKESFEAIKKHVGALS